MSEKKTDPIHARLRLVKSDDLDLCSSYRATAASPLGSDVRLCSMSETVDGASPTREPISAKVIPMERKSDTREAHVVMGSSIREPVNSSQRVSVSALRNNERMPRPKDMPKEIDLGPPGPRIRWWRKHRKLSPKDLASACGMGTSTLTDLELGRTERGSYLHMIAAKLRLNAHYVETGKGEPELEYAQEAPADESWPLPGVPRAEIAGLNAVELKYAEIALLEALETIRKERRKAKHG